MARSVARALVVALAVLFAASGSFGHHDDVVPDGGSARVGFAGEPFYPHAAHPCSVCSAASAASALPETGGAVPLPEAVLVDGDRPAKAPATRRALRRGRAPPDAA